MMRYKMDEDGNIIPVEDLLEWVVWYAEADRTIGKTQIGELTVSTVFLAMSHRSNNFAEDGDDYLFETMVFGPDELLQKLHAQTPEVDTSIFAKVFGMTDIQRRYRSAEEARQGHAAIVAAVREVMEAG
jgi:hypothetical protein